MKRDCRATWLEGECGRRDVIREKNIHRNFPKRFESLGQRSPYTRGLADEHLGAHIHQIWHALLITNEG